MRDPALSILKHHSFENQSKIASLPMMACVWILKSPFPYRSVMKNNVGRKASSATDMPFLEYSWLRHALNAISNIPKQNNDPVPKYIYIHLPPPVLSDFRNALISFKQDDKSISIAKDEKGTTSSRLLV